jgi:hypothetical protein
MRSRDSVLLEFEQLLNFMFRRSDHSAGAWHWKELNVEDAFQGFCRDACSVVPRTELHVYAKQNWLFKRGYQNRPDVTKSLAELLDTQVPLRA